MEAYQLKPENIRNFCIIAHIDHGKSTLADRFIQICGGLSDREMAEQVLDSMDLERERGITIKAQSVTLDYLADDGETYQLNLIDTPGHVDFSYEVSRSLAACEGALLVVDAAQGVEAQSVANTYTAVEQGLEVIPVINKIDLPAADPDRVRHQIEDIIGIDASDALLVSAKTGVGVREILEQLITRVPAPENKSDGPLRALIIDSWFNNYLGVNSLIRIKQGTLRKGEKLRIMSTGEQHQAEQVGIFTPKRTPTGVLECGQVGFLAAGIKEVHGAPVGDTVTHLNAPTEAPLPGFKPNKPSVFAGIFPVDSSDYPDLRDALERLQLNDSALQFEPETSVALGFGFRCGFLGMLHMEIVQERLEREYDLDLITTSATVIYELMMSDGEVQMLDNPAGMPPANKIAEIREPIILANILVPQDHVGPVIGLCEEKRGAQRDMRFLGGQVQLSYELPLSEVVMDFFDRLKSCSRGYASFEYEFDRYQAGPFVRLDLLINGDRVDALSSIVHRDFAERRGRDLAERMRELIPRQMFDIAIQASIGAHIIARSTVKAYRKNVTAKCYGGDVSRKRKLLEKQKAGKRRMKQVGSVEIPQEAFLAVLKSDNEK